MTASQMREIDRRAQEEFLIPELILMEHAGTAVARRAYRLFARSVGGRRATVAVFSGGGANGGDGFVAARHLHNWGVDVQVVLFADPGRIRNASQTNLRILRRLSVPCLPVSSIKQWRIWSGRRVHPLGIVDALLGTGVSGRIREPIRSGILWINRQRCPVVSVDLPSGISADTGCPEDVAVRADVTVTCGHPKLGLKTPEGRRWSGSLIRADISLPRALR